MKIFDSMKQTLKTVFGLALIAAGVIGILIIPCLALR